ncbi:hypothetical protein Uis1B_0607 [Bifidobacterium margollesii]|uniref:ABC-2 family transporter protein n=1 Tax=Bifidobacterium margollesii TaxID=2020964 RepID=A0A2N5JBN3_9BIFI|nr:ABC-2 transporter permease [Bifidobacterium margollesii]PLS31615.1 hypothetical protein Uis1B_0607 [Bifidobacterium margollesii]
MNAMVKSMRVDWARMTSVGYGMVVGYVLSMPILMVVLTLVIGGDAATAGILWLYKYLAALNLMMYVSFMTFPSVYQDMGNNADMNGLMPVSRRNQVLGRYVYLLIFGVIFILTEALTYPLAFAVAGQLGSMGALPWGTLAALLFAYVVLAAIVLVLVYRFKAQTLLYVVVFAGSGLMLCGFVLAARFSDQVQTILGWLGSHVFSSVWLTGVLGVVIAAVVLAGSYLLSVRLYERKEM